MKVLLIEAIPGGAKALFLRRLQAEVKRPLVVITEGVREDRLFENLSSFPGERVVECPAWETLPGEEIPPSADILGKRFAAFSSLLHEGKNPIVLTPLASLLQKVIPKREMAPLLSECKAGQKVPFADFTERLVNLGYKRVPIVSDKGEFAVRGGIIDLFPVASSDPFRLEFVGSLLEEIRSFDPISQKSVKQEISFLLTPASELKLLQKSAQLSSLLDYLEEPILVFDDLELIEEHYVSLLSLPSINSPFSFSIKHFLEEQKEAVYFTSRPIEELSSEVKKKGVDGVVFEAFSSTLEAKRLIHPFSLLTHFFGVEETLLSSLPKKLPSKTSIFVVGPGEEEEVRGVLASGGIDAKNASFVHAPLQEGFVDRKSGEIFIAGADLTERHRIRRQKWRTNHLSIQTEFTALSPGDLVVHFHSGIAKFLGVEKKKNHLGQENEFLILEYAGDSKLFVPLSQSHLISRYIGTEEKSPPLSQLGGKKWQATCQAVQAKIVGYASDLLALYAEREAKGGFVYPPHSPLYRRFEEEFPYEATPDQQAAIDAVLQDMCSAKAMDRLVCGDVGYGKTEVAMRAAFKAVADGKKQVAVLVPTTLLALQHYETFQERMRSLPVKIALLSRFQTAKEAKQILEQVLLGDIDILIGTHRILSADVRFADLGLLIVDEEQRFGVRAKEHLKKKKAGIDCLTLSATPIPRTLYFSLVSARDMSVIATPPQDRLPIKTILAEYDPLLIQNALLREFARGGQAFFIHNRVETLGTKASELQKLVPNAKIVLGHGQMDPEDVEAAIHAFKEGKADILVATTILENGIDIPNSNTLFVDGADTYGMADLYQLRGRVGRWNRAAYAYFLIPKNKRLPEIAQKRLSALVEASGYGGGMKIAMRDLEIRGAGDLLGVDQSGQVSAIGFHLYCRLLKKAIAALKKQKPIEFFETKIDFPFDARLPESYIGDITVRMELYYRFGEAIATEELDDLLAEMEDRFGKAPEEALYLYHIARIRVQAGKERYTLLKLDEYSLTTEQKKGEEKVLRKLLWKKGSKTPSLLEAEIMRLLGSAV